MVGAGWLTDRVDSRYLLFAYYFFRGLSLLVVLALDQLVLRRVPALAGWFATT